MVSVCTIAVFLLLIFSHKVLDYFTDIAMQSESDQVSDYLNRDLDSLSNKVKKVADDNAAMPFLFKSDSVDILSSLVDERRLNNFDIIMLIDRLGSVVMRTNALGFRGDNIFRTTPWGQELSENGSVKSVESDKIIPLVLVAGHILTDGKKMIGALVAEFRLDNVYAKKMKDTILHPNSEIAIYSKKDGIVGTTFEDKETINILNAYFNSSENIESIFTEKKEVVIKDRYYSLKNIVLPGVEESQGGILLFIQNPYKSGAIIFASFMALLFFLFRSYEFKRKYYVINRDRYIIMTTIWSALLFLFVFLLAYSRLCTLPLQLKKSSDIVPSSSMKLSPEADIVDIAFRQQVEIKVSSGGEPINTVQAIITYDPKKIRVTDILTTGSICNPKLFLKNSIDNTNGRVKILCGVSEPYLSGSSGRIAKLSIQPLIVGNFNLNIDKESLVLADDTTTSNILKETVGGSYTVINSVAFETGARGVLPIFSYSHPNSQRWYRSKIVKISWPKIEGYHYKYALTKDPYTVPDINLITDENSLSLKVDSDGMYYFHLLPYRDGQIRPISRLKINIDSTSPNIWDILMNNMKVVVGDVVKFDIKSTDSLSGLQDGAYVRIDEGILAPVKTPIYIPFPKKGDYHILFRIFDNAENFQDNSVDINVR
jgi:hypothetical protein